MISIEYVCSGNHARSPMAEVIAKDYVQRKGLAERVKVYSSGSALHPRFDQGKTIDHRLAVVERGLQGGIFGGAIEKLAIRAIRQKDEAAIQHCYQAAEREEEILRNIVLYRIGLFAEGIYKQPTRERTDIDLLLPVAQLNVEQVRAIYGPDTVRPQIVLLNTYAGLSGDVENPFCQLLPAYQRVRDHLMMAVPKTIDRAVEEW